MPRLDHAEAQKIVAESFPQQAEQGGYRSQEECSEMLKDLLL